MFTYVGWRGLCSSDRDLMREAVVCFPPPQPPWLRIRSYIPRGGSQLMLPSAQARFTISNKISISINIDLFVFLLYTVKKFKRFSRPQPGCQWLNSPWAGIFPPRESLVSDIPAGDGKMANLFLQCIDLTFCETCHFSDYNVAIHIKMNGLEQAKNRLVPGVTLTQTWCLLSGLQNCSETTASTCSWETVRQKSSCNTVMAVLALTETKSVGQMYMYSQVWMRSIWDNDEIELSLDEI